MSSTHAACLLIGAALLTTEAAAAQCQSPEHEAVVRVEARFPSDDVAVSNGQQMGHAVFIDSAGLLLIPMHVVHNGQVPASRLRVQESQCFSSATRAALALVLRRPVDIQFVWANADQDAAIIRVPLPSGTRVVAAPIANLSSGATALSLVHLNGNNVTPRVVGVTWSHSHQDFDLTLDSDARSGRGEPRLEVARIYAGDQRFAVLVVNQTVQPGMSGSPLFDDAGRVVAFIDVSSHYSQAVAVADLPEHPPSMTDTQLRSAFRRFPHTFSPQARRARASLVTVDELETFAAVCPSAARAVYGLRATQAASYCLMANSVGHAEACAAREVTEVTAVEAAARSAIASLNADRECGPSDARQRMAGVLERYLRALELRRRVGSLWTLWSVIDLSLVHPPVGASYAESICEDTSHGRWGRYGSARINPIERLLLCELPGGPMITARLRVRRTNLCEVIRVLDARGLVPTGTACTDPQVIQDWDVIMRSLPDVPWIQLALPGNIEAQARFWEQLAASRLLDLPAALRYATGTSTQVLAERIASVGQLAAAVRGISTVDSIDGSPFLAEHAGTVRDLQAHYSALPDAYRDALVETSSAQQVMAAFAYAPLVAERLRCPVARDCETTASQLLGDLRDDVSALLLILRGLAESTLTLPAVPPSEAEDEVDEGSTHSATPP